MKALMMSEQGGHGDLHPGSRTSLKTGTADPLHGGPERPLCSNAKGDTKMKEMPGFWDNNLSLSFYVRLVPTTRPRAHY